MLQFQEEINNIYEKALKNASHLESWQGHFLARKTEAEILINKFKFSKSLIGLEIGCGNAFQSALIALFCGRVFATDIFREAKSQHYFGTKQVKELKDNLGVKNMELVSCSALNLPFSDGYFDFVYSSSVLEHIKNRDQALSEIRRVLKPDGVMILTVPTHMPSLYAFMHSFLYIISRMSNILTQRQKQKIATVYSSKGTRESTWARFRKNHPSFPLPEPHGDYPSVFHEFFHQLPLKWSKLLKKSGFSIQDYFCMNIIPWSLIEPISTKKAAQIYSGLKNFHLKNKPKVIMSYCGYLVCFISGKNIPSKNVANRKVGGESGK
ncbi:MAG: class I SAM-dependent methyltransferase [Candidatus Omnitrophica bacterium]|nr:class I SAM-dependent methyltransferase [Candidatus Omnitrophota bacterium]